MQDATAISTYNGWTNRETWLVNLWIMNDEGYYRQYLDIIATYGGEYEQAEALKEWMQLEHEELEITNLWSDVVAHTLGQVNWLEIVHDNNEEAL